MSALIDKRADVVVPATLEAMVSASLDKVLLPRMRLALTLLQAIRAAASDRSVTDASVGRQVREILGAER